MADLTRTGDADKPRQCSICGQPRQDTRKRLGHNVCDDCWDNIKPLLRELVDLLRRGGVAVPFAPEILK